MTLAGNPKVPYVKVQASGFVSRVNAAKLLRTPLNINWQESHLFDDMLA